ncbi:hypothetical protein AgCh_011699 [Apium graveolens]
MLDENNKLAEGFRYACDRLDLSDTDDFNLILVSSESASSRPNQVGLSNELAVLVIADSDDTCPFWDIVVQTKKMYLKRVFETWKNLMQLQYPLLFPYGDDGFHLNIPLHKKNKEPIEPVNDQHLDEHKGRTIVTMREFYAYKLMIYLDEGYQTHSKLKSTPEHSDKFSTRYTVVVIGTSNPEVEEQQRDDVLLLIGDQIVDPIERPNAGPDDVHIEDVAVEDVVLEGIVAEEDPVGDPEKNE